MCLASARDTPHLGRHSMTSCYNCFNEVIEPTVLTKTTSYLYFTPSKPLKSSLCTRNTYTPILKKRYAHIIGISPGGGSTSVHSHAVSDQIFCAQALPHEQKHKYRRAQRVLKKTLRTPSGRRGARPRSGRFFFSPLRGELTKHGNLSRKLQKFKQEIRVWRIRV